VGAAHSFEIPFFLGTDSLNGPLYTWRLFTRANRAGRKALSGLMMDYVSSFVRTGDPSALPSAAGRPHWRPWSNEDGGPKVITFDAAGDEAAVEMRFVEDTRERIETLMREELEPELFSETVEYLDWNQAR
jgi:carboxylesterase type B